MKKFISILVLLALTLTASAATWYVDDSRRDAKDYALSNSCVVKGGYTVRTNSPFIGETGMLFTNLPYLSVASNDTLNVTTQMTVAAWIYPYATADDNFIYRGTMANSQGAWRLALFSGSIYFVLNQATTFFTAPITTGVWTHVAAVIDGTTAMIYTNGHLAASTPYSLAITNVGDLFLGAGYNVSGYAYNGRMSDVQLWNIARTSNQIFTTATTTTRLIGTESGLVGYWKLDDLPVDGTTKETAYYLIQSAIDATAASDTVIVSPGVYTNIAFINGIGWSGFFMNKNGVIIQGGQGTLWDADRTIINVRHFPSAFGVHMRSSNNVIRGVTFCGSVNNGLYYETYGTSIVENCIFRSNDNVGVYAFAYNMGKLIIKNSIAVGNGWGGFYIHNTGVQLGLLGCLAEGNGVQQVFSSAPAGALYKQNTIHGNQGGNFLVNDYGGNITNQSTNIVALFGIARGSDGYSNNLIWRGVGAYLPRGGRATQEVATGFFDDCISKDGNGGPAMFPFAYRFLGAGSLTTGTCRVDSSLVGGIILSTNSPFTSETSADLNGTNAYFVTDTCITNYPFTLEAWVSTDITTPEQAIISIHRNALATTYYTIAINNANRPIIVARNTSAQTGTAPSTVGTNTWVHIAGVFGSATSRVLYVNGAAVVTNTASVAYDADTIYVGRLRSTDFVWLFNGRVSDARVWSTARTPVEILANYTNRLTGGEAGLAAYWKYNEEVGSIGYSGPFNMRNRTLQQSFMEAY